MNDGHGTHANDELWVCHLGTVPYREALAMQADIRARRQTDELPDTLLLLEHPPVYTRGRRSRDDELTLGEDFYAARGIDVVETDRGGRVTYHGPGQLVAYPIMRTIDIGSYLRTMESSIIAAWAELSALTARRLRSISGVTHAKLTLYASAAHVFMYVAGLRWDTHNAAGPGDTGPRLRSSCCGSGRKRLPMPFGTRARSTFTCRWSMGATRSCS